MTAHLWFQKARMQVGEQEARWILEKALEKDSATLLTIWEKPLLQEKLDLLDHFLQRRLKKEPLQYILEEAHFFGLTFKVGPGVFIPRPETEQLVEKALELLPPGKLKVAELGAGSGCIGLALLSKRPEIEWHAYEIERAAFSFAIENAKRFSYSQYHLHFGDFFQVAAKDSPFDWIISNPPYIAQDFVPDVEVSQEPKTALFSGLDGLETIRKIATQTSILPRGKILLEIGADQGEKVLKEFKDNGFTDAKVFQDLQGKDRMVFACRS